MRETQFIEKNEQKWREYERALESGSQDTATLRELYVHITDDLSYARTFYPNRSVRVYLNSLAQRTFLQIYRGRRGQASRFITFWTDELPRLVYANRRAFYLALAVFLLAGAIGIVSYLIDPEFANLYLGDNYMRMTRANISSGDPMAIYKQRGEYGMFLGITFNNIYVAFMTFALGAFFGIGTIVMLINTGVMLGVFQYFFVDQGLFQESFLTIWIHGALEISSIVIAGAAGLTMGRGLLFPGTQTRLRSFQQSARDGLKIMLGTVPLFIIAGFLEGYLTRHNGIGDTIRLLFILSNFAFVFFYFVYYPYLVTHRSDRSEFSADERIIPTAAEKSPDRGSIMGVGETVSWAFTIFRRRVGPLLGYTTLIIIGFCLLTFGLGNRPSEMFGYHREIVGESFLNASEITHYAFNRGVGHVVAVALAVYALLLLGGTLSRHELDGPRTTSLQEYLRLTAPAGLLTVCVLVPSGWTAFLFFLTLPFLLTWSYRSLTDANEGPRESFRLVYTRLGQTLGIFLLILLLGFICFSILNSTVTTTIFSFLNWVISADAITLNEYNVVIQTFIYFFYFAMILLLFQITLAVNFYSVREMEQATVLRENIERIGSGRTLRGLAMEE
ncbi:MAG: stage II sporulation protein M [Saprospiraceae bacterium]